MSTPAQSNSSPAEPDSRSDAELIAAHCAGDPHAFTEIVRRHRDRLWAVALRTTSDPEEAADALQDALISAFRRADQFRGESAVTTWLHRIVVNASLDRMRRRSVRPWVPLPDESAERPGDVAALRDPRDAMSERETSLEIQAALAELPPDQRAAVVLVDLEGWPVDEAARILQCPPGTVKSRCFRGRAKLAERLAHLRNPDAGDGVPPPDRTRGAAPPHDDSAADDRGGGR